MASHRQQLPALLRHVLQRDRRGVRGETFQLRVKQGSAHSQPLDGHQSSALAHLGNASWALGEKVPLGTRPALAAGCGVRPPGARASSR